MPTVPFYISTRCSRRLKKRVKRAASEIGQGESELLRSAVSEFFNNHPTAKERLAAVMKWRAEGGTND